MTLREHISTTAFTIAETCGMKTACDIDGQTYQCIVGTTSGGVSQMIVGATDTASRSVWIMRSAYNQDPSRAKRCVVGGETFRIVGHMADGLQALVRFDLGEREVAHG